MARDDFYARVARSQADRTIRLANRGECVGALQRYVLASVDASNATYEDRQRYGVEAALSRAEQAFINSCMRR